MLCRCNVSLFQVDRPLHYNKHLEEETPPRTQIGRALRELGIGWIAAHSESKTRCCSSRFVSKVEPLQFQRNAVCASRWGSLAISAPRFPAEMGAGIDDAASRALARFVEHDSTVENMALLRCWLESFDRPRREWEAPAWCPGSPRPR
jgi:hypothetical protein